MGNKNPLVSICVITYNSSEYIIDTLESVKNQTYSNIELIISDDCSTDDTIKICESWMCDNSSKFRKALLVTVPKNTGISGNCNRAIEKANGLWVKLLAGDDMLPNYSIQDYVSFVTKEKLCNICFAKLNFFGDDNEYVSENRTIYENSYYPYLKKSGKDQFKEILKRLFVPGPGLFMKKSLWSEVGKYDENYQFCEEYPFTLNVLAKGERLYFIDKELVSYRVRKGSLCRDLYGLNSRVFNDHRRYFIDYRRRQLLKHGYIFHAWHETITMHYMYSKYKYGDKSLRLKFIRFMYALSPVSYINKVNRILRRI